MDWLFGVLCLPLALTAFALLKAGLRARAKTRRLDRWWL